MAGAGIATVDDDFAALAGELHRNSTAEAGCGTGD
jgi:hypothetical protein